MKQTSVTLLALAPVFCAFSQSFENVTAEVVGKTVVVTYDLADSRPDLTFSVRLYCSHNGFAAPLRSVAGDIGSRIKPGSAKHITWDGVADMSGFKGELVFELRGAPEIVKLKFNDQPLTRTARQGKSTTISWTGGNLYKTVKIELVSGTSVTVLGDRPNTGSFSWSVPTDAAMQSGYTIKISAGDEAITSTSFSIKRKTPLVLIIGPAVAIVGLVVYILLPDELPSAPDPS